MQQTIKIFSTTGEFTPLFSNPYFQREYRNIRVDFANGSLAYVEEQDDYLIQDELEEHGLEYYGYFYEVSLQELPIALVLFEAMISGYIDKSSYLGDDDYYDNIPDAFDQILQMAGYIMGPEDFKSYVKDLIEDYKTKYPQLTSDEEGKSYFEQFLQEERPAICNINL